MARGRVYLRAPGSGTPYFSICPRMWVATFSGLVWGYCTLSNGKFAADPNVTIDVDESTGTNCGWIYQDPLVGTQTFDLRTYGSPGCTGATFPAGRAEVRIIRDSTLGGWRVTGQHIGGLGNPFFFDSGWVATPLIRTFTNTLTSDGGGTRYAHSGQCTIVSCG